MTLPSLLTRQAVKPLEFETFGPVFDPDAPQVWEPRSKKATFSAQDHAEIARERRAKRRASA